MPIMTRMRESMPYVLFGLLIAFLITIVFEWGMDYLGIQTRSSDVVGKVNSRKITYKEFSDLVKVYSDNQRAQTGVEPDETQMVQLRDQVWQMMVTQTLVEEEIERMGITVTDDELREWVRGDNPPDDLRRNFLDSTNTFRRDIYDRFLNNPNEFLRDPEGNDPNYGTRWLVQFESNLRQRRAQEKLQSVVFAAIQVTEGEILNRFTDQRVTFDVNYAIFDANQMIKEDEVAPTDDELRKYYQENTDQYKVEAQRLLKYVQFLEAASAADSSSRRSEIEDAAAKANGGHDFIGLTGTYGARVDSGSWFGHGELTASIDSMVFSAKVGEVVGPWLEADGYHLTKVLDERRSDKERVRASHILLSLDAAANGDSLKGVATRLAAEARRGRDFATLARQHSQDPGSASRGGDLGWFTKGRMVKEFEEATFRLRPGQVSDVVKTTYGYHIIKLHQRDNRERKISSIVLGIAASPQTKNDLFERARDFAFNARENDFASEAQSTGLEVKESQVQEKGGFVPGIGVNEAITRWAFQNDAGDISEPFTVPTGYVVFTVSEVKNAGVKPFDEVKETITPLVLRDKKTAKAAEIAAAAKAKLSPTDSLTRVRQIQPAVSVQRSGPFTLTNGAPGVGRDLGFIGAVSGLSPGQISSPVTGFRGAYLIQLVSRSAFDSAAYAMEREALRTQLLQEKKNRFMTDWIAKLKENADIEDNRYDFFR
jgi:parvulin-like peptidyl-prolyl isomerase